jgi:hypothetical protein
MKKKNFQILLIFLFAYLNIYSQNYILTGGEFGYYKSITYFPTKSNPAETNIDYNLNTPIVGSIFIQESTHAPPFERDNIMRTKVTVSLGSSTLNLAPNEKIDLAKMVVTTNSSSGSGGFNIKFIGNLSAGTNPQEYWEECNSGSYIGSLTYSSGGNITITDIIRNNIGNNVYFGFYEGGNGNANLYSISVQIWTSIVPQISITAQNSFPNSGGSIKVGINNSATSKTSPYTFSAYPEISTVNLEAVDQNYDFYGTDYYWIWNDTEAPLNLSNWERNGETRSFDQEHTFTASASDANKTYKANLRKRCSITFKNNFIGISNGGNIKVNGTSYSAPTSNFNVVEQNKITAEATQYYEFNAIQYAFQNWNGESTSKTKDFYPSQHEQYVANYKGTPLFSDVNYRNLSFNSFNPRTQNNVILTWNEHPNPNVTKYQIWRHEKYNGVYTAPVLLATVNRGTTTWTDYGFFIGNSSSDYQLFYDVRAYYSIENTYSVDSYKQCYGTSTAVNKIAEIDSIEVIEEILENNSSNYPNPYNPTTTISYQIKETGNVRITVYDALGRKVKDLVNELKNPGRYEVRFDGNNLSSGIYFYTMNINNFTSTKKMILTK